MKAVKGVEIHGYIDVGDEMCWSQLRDVGDQHLKNVANIVIRSPTPKNCHLYPLVTNIYVAETHLFHNRKTFLSKCSMPNP